MRITLPRVSLRAWFAVTIVAAYLLGKMFYLSGQGAAQPADVGMVAGFLLLVTPRAALRMAGVNVFLLLLMLWAVTVNLGWAMLTGNLEFLTSVTYYLFNLGIVLAVFWTRQKNPRLFDLVMPAVILLAMIGQVLFVTFFSGGYRSEGTFENPNQLAFWCLCCMTIWILCRPGRLGLPDLAVALGLGWVEICSLSRAGMAALGLLLLIWLFRTVRSTRARLIAVGIIIAGGLVLAVTPVISHKVAESQLMARAEERINRQQPESELEYRGYDRIIAFVGHIVIGAGEGEKERFADTGAKHAIEIHSTFGTLIFSYGILGITLFGLFVWRLTQTIGLERYVYLVPSLAYGFTHNGLRFSFFWFMVGMLLSLAITEGRRLAPVRAPPAPGRPAYGGPAPANQPMGRR